MIQLKVLVMILWPGDSPANISVPVKEVDVGVSPDVMVVATVSPKKDGLELLDAYNTIKKLELDVANANKLVAERDLKMLELERQKVEVANVGKLKFEKLYQNWLFSSHFRHRKM